MSSLERYSHNRIQIGHVLVMTSVAGVVTNMIVLVYFAFQRGVDIRMRYEAVDEARCCTGDSVRASHYGKNAVINKMPARRWRRIGEVFVVLHFDTMSILVLEYHTYRGHTR